jgi:hypothetical protein
VDGGRQRGADRAAARSSRGGLRPRRREAPPRRQGLRADALRGRPEAGGPLAAPGDDGLLEDVGFLPVPAWGGSRETLYARPPAAGAGTYEIRDFTLLLTYDDGRRWSADFSIHGDDPKDLSKLLLKTGVLHRETP